MKNIKKVVLTLVLVFAFGIVINASKNENINKENNLIVTDAPPECWGKADAAEIAFCGYANCNLSYWLGYWNACIAAKAEDE